MTCINIQQLKNLVRALTSCLDGSFVQSRAVASLRSWHLVALLCSTASIGSDVASADDRSRQAGLRGRVADAQGRPLEATFISVSDGRGRTLGETRTASDGRYHLDVAASERYEVWAGKTEGYLFRYIPQSRATSGAPVDFTLHAGANIVFAAFDSTGARIDNAAFRRISAGRVFLTDLADATAEGTLSAVHNETSGWQWEKAWPAAIVAPGRRYKVLLQWEVPDVGKLLFALDNGGEGYEVPEPGGRLELNVEREIARSALAALRRHDQAGDAAAAVGASRQFLADGEDALAATPPDRQRAARAFGLSTKSSLTAHETLVMDRATADIERHRKGDVDVTVIDAAGVPLPGVTVAFEQTSSDFIFGAHPLGLNGSYDKGLGDLMKAAGMNQSYITARWGQLEPRPGEFDWSNIDKYQDPRAQQASGYGLIGALGLWLAGNADFAPGFLASGDFDRLRDSVARYGEALARRYAGRVDIWDLNELNLETTNRFKLGWHQRLEIGRVFAHALKAGNPRAKVMLSSLALAHDAPGSRSFADLLRTDLEPDIVGIELYHAGVNTDRVSTNGLDLVAMDRLLDGYAAFGKPIVVKEFSVPSVQVDASSWWHRPWDEALQAKFVTDVYTIGFSKRLVRGMVWAWGVSDADAYITGGGLVDSRMRPKESYFALRRLLQSWTSHGSVTTDRNGKAAWRGFGGGYRVVARRDGREIHVGQFHVEEQRATHLVIRVNDAIAGQSKD